MLRSVFPYLVDMKADFTANTIQTLFCTPLSFNYVLLGSFVRFGDSPPHPRLYQRERSRQEDPIETPIDEDTDTSYFGCRQLLLSIAI